MAETVESQMVGRFDMQLQINYNYSSEFVVFTCAKVLRLQFKFINLIRSSD